MHHALGDGIAMVLFYSNLCDKCEVKDLPRLAVKVSKREKFLMFLIMPFFQLYVAIFNLFILPYQRHSYKAPEAMKKLNIKKNGSFSRDISLDLVK